LRRFVAILPLVAALLAIAAYAGLLPAAKWQGDEYLGAWRVSLYGWRHLRDRLIGWSPRPASETLTWLYFVSSNALDRPLIFPFVALLWAVSLAGVAAAGWAARVRGPVQLALLLFALTLQLIKPGEMFYWPEAAAAYLPCWAALAAVTVLHRTDLGQHRVALAVALSIAAFSAEIGAFMVLVYAALIGAASPRRQRLHRLAPLILPALGAVAVCLIVHRDRMEPSPEVMDAASGLAGSWPASLRAAIPTVAREAAGIAGLPLLAGAAIKLALLLCLPSNERGAPRVTVLWAAALLLVAFVSVVVAYHQFGTLCCERHVTMRQGMVVLALAALAGLLGGAARVPRQIGLAAVVLGLLWLRAAPLAAEWRALPDVIAARQRTWASAAADGDGMTLFLAPHGDITNAESLPIGQFRRAANAGDTPAGFGSNPWYAMAIMGRFDKHALAIAPLPSRPPLP
jgi:hypothetical protein